MKDLSITFCGVPCENPFFLGSACITATEDMCARALEAGWGGIVFKTIGFYRAHEVSPRFDAVRTGGGHFESFRNLEQISDKALDENLKALAHLKQRFPDKVIVASIVGETEEEWERLARLAEEAGVDLIECNFSCPQMAAEAMGADVGVNAELVGTFCRAVRRGTQLRFLAKMTPNITDITLPARAAMAGGADGIAAINTVKSLTHVAGGVVPSVGGHSSISGLSGRAIRPIALRFVHDIASCPELAGVPISGIGGITTAMDALDFLALGATNLQVVTAVMEYGYRIIDDLADGLSRLLDAQGSELADVIGSALSEIVPCDALDRQTIRYPSFAQEGCIGCGRCYVSCEDGGHQAIHWQKDRRRPILDETRCVGCQLCRLVCPVGAIEAAG